MGNALTELLTAQQQRLAGHLKGRFDLRTSDVRRIVAEATVSPFQWSLEHVDESRRAWWFGDKGMPYLRVRWSAERDCYAVAYLWDGPRG